MKLWFDHKRSDTGSEQALKLAPGAERQREANGLREDQCELSVQALKAIVADDTREAGVPQLKREIGRAMRHAARCRCPKGTAHDC